MPKRPNQILLNRKEGDNFCKHKVNEFNLENLKEKWRKAKEQYEEDKRIEEEERLAKLKEEAEEAAKAEMKKEGYIFKEDKEFGSDEEE